MSHTNRRRPLPLPRDGKGRGPAKPVRRCRECGCTDRHACIGGCWWVGDDLCSSCDEADLTAFGETLALLMEGPLDA